MTSPNVRWIIPPILYWIAVLCLIGLSSCATGADRLSWIRIGVTTREEVIERFGEPDMVSVSSDGETATYSPDFSQPAPPPPVAQVAEAGPDGKMIFRSQPIIRGLGAPPVTAGTHDRPKKPLRIHYDTNGIVQSVRD